MPINWKYGGLALGAVFLMAVLLVKPIGVSTQFVIFDGILWDRVDESVVVESADTKSGYASSNAYLNKSSGKYAASVAKPLNYSFVFVLAMMLGGAASTFTRAKVSASERRVPKVWQANFGSSPAKRYLATFVGGFIVLYGARMAGGCTSGHMMSGMMQTAVSGYLFALATFSVAIPVALFLYRKEG